ncbi:MAG: hypothetical protein Aurels2KO_09910 [Aureliella sp.]
MLDRASTFAQPEIVALLKKHFVPVALDQANQRRQKDTEGEFYRKIANQSPRNNFNRTTQGFYIATAAGKLLLYNNNRDPEKVLRLMREKLAEFDQEHRDTPTEQIVSTSVDSRYTMTPPEGGLVVRVRAKVLDGYEPTSNRWQRIFQTALSRDNLWITAKEHRQLASGVFPETLIERIARFHMVDNTRGEPRMWKRKEIKSATIQVSDGGKLSGSIRISNAQSGYEAQLRGQIEVTSGKVTKLEMVALGEYWGEGPYTKNAPEGRFPLGIAFTLADGTNIADDLAPQGARGWLEGYLK